MEPDVQDLLDAFNLDIRFKLISTISQTLVYGLYLCLVPITVHAMVTNGLQSRARKWLFTITTSMFALSTVYWILSVVLNIIFIDSWNSIVAACYGSDHAFFCIISGLAGMTKRGTAWVGIFPSIFLINFNIADGIVVWRAWVLCSEQSKAVLMAPVVMLAINTIIYLVAVVARTIGFLSEGGSQMPLYRIVNITQAVHLTFSVFINIFATSIIALKAWKYRKFLIENGIGIRTPRQAIRVLALLVESGMIYILIGVVSTASISIFLHFGLTYVSNEFMLVGIQLVGLYPILVVLLVEKNRSLNSTFSSIGTIIDARGD